MQSFVGMSGNGPRLFIECGLPDRQTERMLDVNKRLAVFEGRDWVVCVLVIVGLVAFVVRLRRRLATSIGAWHFIFVAALIVIELILFAQYVVIAITTVGCLRAADASAAPGPAASLRVHRTVSKDWRWMELCYW